MRFPWPRPLQGLLRWKWLQNGQGADYLENAVSDAIAAVDFSSAATDCTVFATATITATITTTATVPATVAESPGAATATTAPRLEKHPGRWAASDQGE